MAVICIYLQSYLSPEIQASMAFYNCKLQLCNSIIWRLNNNLVKLCKWEEANRGACANEFSGCILDYNINLPEQACSINIK